MSMAPRARPWRMPLVFGGLALCLFYLLWLHWRALGEVRQAQHLLVQTEQVLATLSDLGRQAAPDGMRVLCAATGTPVDAGRAALPERPEALARLQRLLAERPEQRERLATLAGALDEWQALYVGPLETACRTGQRLGAAHVQSLARVALPTQRRVKAQLAALEMAEAGLQGERAARLESALAAARDLFVLVVLASAMLGLGGMLAVHALTKRLATAR